jgi:ornithine cyclodeaminase
VTAIYQFEQIQQALGITGIVASATAASAIIDAIEQGFVLLDAAKAVVPPTGHLNFTQPPGEVHIKYGYLTDDDVYVVKIASGFYENVSAGLPNGNGCMLVFSQKTGELLSILLDRGTLTDLRTAAAGAVAARWLAPKNVCIIGIVGTGVQARLQLQMLRSVVDCRDVIVWGRTSSRTEAYRAEMERRGYHVTIAPYIKEVAEKCQLIVTTTPSREALLFANMLPPDAQVHITAVGSDDLGKQELAPLILGNADRVVVDSLAQCIRHGELAHAQKMVDVERVVTLGSVIANGARRTDDERLTVADLTGVAVQDIQIAKLAYSMLRTDGS